MTSISCHLLQLAVITLSPVINWLGVMLVAQLIPLSFPLHRNCVKLVCRDRGGLMLDIDLFTKARYSKLP